MTGIAYGLTDAAGSLLALAGALTASQDANAELVEQLESARRWAVHLEGENAALGDESSFQRRRADRFRAFVTSQAITARALGASDWERRMLDTLHRDDMTLLSGERPADVRRLS